MLSTARNPIAGSVTVSAPLLGLAVPEGATLDPAKTPLVLSMNETTRAEDPELVAAMLDDEVVAVWVSDDNSLADGALVFVGVWVVFTTLPCEGALGTIGVGFDMAVVAPQLLCQAVDV